MTVRTRLRVAGRTIDNEAVGDMTRALRRTAEYASWETLDVGQRARLPDIEDIGAYLGDERWAGWAARREMRRLADAPRTGYRRWRITLLVAMPGWFANLHATYVDVVPRTASATDARRTTADRLAAEAEALRASGKTISEAAEAVGRESTTVVRYRHRKPSG